MPFLCLFSVWWWECRFALCTHEVHENEGKRMLVYFKTLVETLKFSSTHGWRRRATWKVLGLHGTKTKKKKKTSLLSFSERQNVALPSFCCLSSRFKIFYLPCSHGEQRHSRKDRTRCSDQYQRPPYGPRLLPSEGMSALCVFVNEREHLCVFFFPRLTFSSFASKAKLFLKTYKCADVFLGSTPPTQYNHHSQQITSFQYSC